MTEDEAKTKWCPFVRLTADQGEWHVNRHPGDPQDPALYACVGSACMAWRTLQAARVDEVVVRDGDAEPGSDWVEVERYGIYPGAPRDRTRYERRHPETGYCGLAGAPQ